MIKKSSCRTDSLENGQMVFAGAMLFKDFGIRMAIVSGVTDTSMEMFWEWSIKASSKIEAF